MEMYELEHELQWTCRRRALINKIRNYSLIVGGALVTVAAATFVVNETRNQDEK